jgi:hypothetical protein
VPFILLLVIAGLGATVLRRGEQALIASSEAGDEPVYDARLAVVRSWTLLTITLIVVTIFFMSAKPFG